MIIMIAGATLMGCELNPKIVYVEFTAVVRKQKEILKKLVVKKQEQIRKVHPGLTCFREGVREVSVESIPGILETGWEPPAYDRTRYVGRFRRVNAFKTPEKGQNS